MGIYEDVPENLQVDGMEGLNDAILLCKETAMEHLKESVVLLLTHRGELTLCVTREDIMEGTKESLEARFPGVIIEEVHREAKPSLN